MGGKCDEAMKNATANFICRGFCLFDLETDPCETTNIADNEPEIVNDLKAKMATFWNELVPQKPRFVDPAANPDFCNGVWFNWKDNYCPFNDKETLHTVKHQHGKHSF